MTLGHTRRPGQEVVDVPIVNVSAIFCKKIFVTSVSAAERLSLRLILATFIEQNLLLCLYDMTHKYRLDKPFF